MKSRLLPTARFLQEEALERHEEEEEEVEFRIYIYIFPASI